MEPLECARHRGDCKNSTMKGISNLILRTYQVPSALFHCRHFTDETTEAQRSRRTYLLFPS